MMGILSISVGRMCKPISPPCFNIWQIVVDRLAARDMLLYAHTSNQSPLFRYLANRGGQACSKRGASVCSNATVPRMIQYLSTPRCFFQCFHATKIHFFAKSTKTTTTSLQQTPKETKLHSTMMEDLDQAKSNYNKLTISIPLSTTSYSLFYPPSDSRQTWEMNA